MLATLRPTHMIALGDASARARRACRKRLCNSAVVRVADAELGGTDADDGADGRAGDFARRAGAVTA